MANLPVRRLIDDDGSLDDYGRILTNTESQHLFDRLVANVPWHQGSVRVFGRDIPEPRLTSWHGDPGSSYSYSGRTVQPSPWTKDLAAIRTLVESLATFGFNSVLANLYRDGRDGVAWHSDDEVELGSEPVIASFSLGASRRFSVRRRDRTGERIDLDLHAGTLIVMRGSFQRTWEHSIPKTRRPVDQRVNLTFRTILPQAT
jgi:alkylated DNA repair dioxygenase AlkB